MAVTSVWDWTSTAMLAHSSGRSSIIVLPGQNTGETMPLGLLLVQRTFMALSDDSKAHPSSSFWVARSCSGRNCHADRTSSPLSPTSSSSSAIVEGWRAGRRSGNNGCMTTLL